MKNVLFHVFVLFVVVLVTSIAPAAELNPSFVIGRASQSADGVKTPENLLKTGPMVDASGVDLETLVPEFMKLVENAVKKYNSGANENEFKYFILKAAQSEIMNEVELEIPGWKDMAALRDGETLLHIVRALVALMTNPEYQNAPAEEKRNVKWAVILHDLAKKPVDPITGEKIRDAIHPFRSAVLAAKILPNHGFGVTDQYESTIRSWSKYTHEAITLDEKGRPIHDNGKLPEITDGIEKIFKRNSSASKIVTSILLHQSLNFLKQWPDAAPITDQEIKRYIDDNLLRALGPLVKADSDSWQLFNPEKKANFDQQIKDRITEIKSLISKP